MRVPEKRLPGTMGKKKHKLHKRGKKTGNSDSSDEGSLHGKCASADVE